MDEKVWSDSVIYNMHPWNLTWLKATISGLCFAPWWRHQMETFSALLALCAGNSPVPGEFPAQRPMLRSFDVFFDLRLNKRLKKQSWGWWFETLSRPLWRHCNAQKTGIAVWHPAPLKQRLLNKPLTEHCYIKNSKCGIRYLSIITIKV